MVKMTIISCNSGPRSRDFKLFVKLYKINGKGKRKKRKFDNCQKQYNNAILPKEVYRLDRQQRWRAISVNDGRH